jgi:hypothetical protein
VLDRRSRALAAPVARRGAHETLAPSQNAPSAGEIVTDVSLGTISGPTAPGCDGAAVPIPPVGVAAPLRTRLPDRRHAITERVTWGPEGAFELEVTVGIDPATGRVSEVFIDGHKSGSALEATMDDAAILASVLLQSGYRAADLAQRITRSDPRVRPDEVATSPIGRMLQFAASIEKEIGEGSR